MEKLASKYKDNKCNVEENILQFTNELKNNYDLELVLVKENKYRNMTAAGEVCYYPKAASIELTTKCNLKCLHCYGSFGVSNAFDMDIEDAKKILKDLDEVGITTIELTGGDVSMYKGLLEILKYSMSLGFAKVNVLSNGVVLSKEILNYIVENKDRIGCQIDLHSLDDTYLNWFTGQKNTLKIVQEKIEFLLYNKVELRIATIFTKKNLKELHNIGDYVASIHGKWGIGLVENLGRACEGNTDLYLNENEMICFQEMLEGENKSHPGMISIIDYLPNDNNCGAMTTRIVINTEGDIKLCTMDNRTYFNNNLGNCRTHSVKDIFDTKMDVVKSLTKYKLPDIGCSKCGDCEKIFGCSRCLLRNFINMKEKNFECGWYLEMVPNEVKQHFFGDEK